MTNQPTPPKPRPCPRRLKAAGIVFTPVPTARKRRDGWTPNRQRDFLAALYACGVVATAAKTVGMSTRTAYRLRARPGAASFSAAWDRLLREASARALDLAVEAGMNEGLVPRRYRGLVTGFVTANNERMIIAALRAFGIARRREFGAPSSTGNADLRWGKGQ